MPELRVLVGIPGSGKSTVCAAWLARDEIDCVVASDSMRAELTGAEDDFSRDHEMWPQLQARVLSQLRAGRRVAQDSTNLTATTRRGLLSAASSCGITPIAYRLDVPFEEAHRRNQARTRVVPTQVMLAFHTNFLEECSHDQLEAEGFRVITLSALPADPRLE